MSDALKLPPPQWLELLSPSLQERLQGVVQRLANEEEEGQAILPPAHLRYSALQCVHPQQVRVVIVGQDPYPTPGNAHGLAFSVQPGTAIPASLRNIFKEIESDIGAPSQCATDGNLLPWARQGVLLLNTTLSVRAGAAGSHEKYGWQAITAAWLQAIAVLNPQAVFLLWGGHAQRLTDALPSTARMLLSVHPSPLSAYRGFFGCRHFSAANALLTEVGLEPVHW